MVKLTTELIEQAMQRTNPVRDRELDLRGYKIPVIENLGSTLDQFDTIDFSDNDIRKIDGFPYLLRLKSLILNNNRVSRIAELLEESIPNLEWLILTNNNITELGDLDTLRKLSHLQHLSLLRNPVMTKKYYRLYVIWRLPQLQRLDFQRVRLVEREAASQLFKGKRGRQFAAEVGKRSKTFVPGAPLDEDEMMAINPPEPTTVINGRVVARTQEEIAAIKKAIVNASSLEEVDRLNQMLHTGHIPGAIGLTAGFDHQRRPDDEEEEMDAD